MSTAAQIRYREFYDVPRIFLVRIGERDLLFTGLFDESLDEYPDFYDVYLMPPLGEDELRGSWVNLHEKATRRLGRIPVTEVGFDTTRRKEIDSDGVEQWARAHAWW
jgi:hypothetical protein